MNAKTITVAVLAVLIAVSLGMVVASEPSEAAPSDAESIDETMEFTALETYELDGRSLVFTEGGRLVFQEASVLSVNGSTHLEGSGTIITLMPGSVVSYMGNLYVVTETIDIGLDGSIDFVLDMDLLSDAPSGSFSVDISDGGEVTMLGGVTRGGPDKEAKAQVEFSEDAMVIAMSMDIPFTSGTMTSWIISSMYPEIQLPFESFDSEMTGMTFEMSANIDMATGAMSLTDMDGSGPAFIEVESCKYSIPEMLEMSMEGMRMTFSLGTDGESMTVPVSIDVDSVNVAMSYGGVSLTADISGLSTDFSMIMDSDGSVSVDGGADGAPFEVGVDSLGLGMAQTVDGSVVFTMGATLTDARVLVSMDLAAGQTVPDTDMTIESGTAAVHYTAVSEGVATSATASTEELTVSAGIGADGISMEASIGSARADLGADGSPFAFGAEVRGMTISATGSQTSSISILSVDSVSMDVQVPVGASTYQKRTVEFQGIEAQMTGSTVSFIKVASMTASGPGLSVDTITETVTGMEVSTAEGLMISFDQYRADVLGLDGSEGYVEATDVASTQDGEISGDYVYALGHNTYRALNGSLSFVSSGIVVYDGMTVEFRDSYIGDLAIYGGTVNGTAYVCGGWVHTVADQERTFTVDGYGGYDVVFDFEDSRIVSAEAALCSDMYLENYFLGIEPYDPAQGGVPYELNDDGTATFTDLSGGTITVPVGLVTFTLTVDGTAAEYSYGTTVTVEASTSQAGMVFAGWFDGIQIAMPGGDYYVRYDAEIQELWAPADYDVVSVEGGLSVDIGEGGVFFVADASTLLGTRNAGPVTELTVTNSAGSVTVDLEEVGSGPLMVMMSEMGQTPVGYINDAASGSKMYMMQASILAPNGESTPLESKVSFTDSAPVSGITSYGQRMDMVPTFGDQYQVGYGEDIVAYALGEPDGSGSGSSMLIIGAVVVVILVIAVAVVVVMRRRNPA